MAQADKYLKKLNSLKLASEAVYLIQEDGLRSVGGLMPDDALIQTALELKSYVLLFARPVEPFMSALNLASKDGSFSPNDSETRTFLHTIPVLEHMDKDALVRALRERKAVFIRNRGIVTAASYGAEQAYIFFCSVCFSGFIKFFSDTGTAAAMKQPYDKTAVRKLIEEYRKFIPEQKKVPLVTDIFSSDKNIITAMAQAGRTCVEMGLVDSFFGNISCFHNDKIYISRTGSSLDELENETDICPLDESSCTGLTASSELASHRKIYELTDNKVILHAHPRFSVIMSMICAEDCTGRGQCHYQCDRERFLNGVPIVAGEVGNGKRAMVNTMPPAVKLYESAIVYGHGTFTVSKTDFNSAFERLLKIENDALNLYQHLTC